MLLKAQVALLEDFRLSSTAQPERSPRLSGHVTALDLILNGLDGTEYSFLSTWPTRNNRRESPAVLHCPDHPPCATEDHHRNPYVPGDAHRVWPVTRARCGLRARRRSEKPSPRIELGRCLIARRSRRLPNVDPRNTALPRTGSYYGAVSKRPITLSVGETSVAPPAHSREPPPLRVIEEPPRQEGHAQDG